MTYSMADALRLLEDTRRYYVEYGRYIAVQICNGPTTQERFASPEVARAIEHHPGLVHAKLVRDEMEARGLFEGYVGGMQWVGAVFRGPAWGVADEAGNFLYADETRNIHDKRLLWWRIADHMKAGEMTGPLPPERYRGARERFKATGVTFGRDSSKAMRQLMAIRSHALAVQRERDTRRSGAAIEVAPRPLLTPEITRWLLRATDSVKEEGE